MEAGSLKISTGATCTTRQATRHRLTSAFSIPVIAISLITLAQSAMASGTVTFSGLVWTGGTCCGQNQPQFIHDPVALVNYFQTRYHNGVNNCPASPVRIGNWCYVFAQVTNIDYRSTGVCPANSTGTPADYPTTCTCDDGYVPDGTSCVPAATCPVTRLSNPPFTDACSTSLEEGKGTDINNKCDELTDDMKKAAACYRKENRCAFNAAGQLQWPKRHDQDSGIPESSVGSVG